MILSAENWQKMLDGANFAWYYNCTASGWPRNTVTDRAWATGSAERFEKLLEKNFKKGLDKRLWMK